MTTYDTLRALAYYSQLFDESCPGVFELLERLGAAHVVLNLYPLAFVEVFVHRKKVADSVQDLLGHVADICRVFPLLVVARYSDELLVPTVLIGHDAHAENLRLDETARKRRKLGDDERVERVAVAAERVGNEAVLRGVTHRDE